MDLDPERRERPTRLGAPSTGRRGIGHDNDAVSPRLGQTSYGVCARLAQTLDARVVAWREGRDQQRSLRAHHGEETESGC